MMSDAQFQAHVEHPTILLATLHEDHHILYRTLLEYHGYRILVPAAGDDVCTMAQREEPDVLVVDLFPSLADSWQIVWQLRADAATRDIAIIALVASECATDRARAFEFDCQACLPSGCEPERLLAAVEALLRAAHRHRASTG